MSHLRKPIKAPNDSVEALARYVERELNALVHALSGEQGIHIPVLNNAPAKPRECGIYAADGTNWNPGSGQGVYAYIGGAYVPLHT